MPGPTPQMTELKRELGLLDATMINVGTMIASAIFIVPATIALQVHYSSLAVLVWIVGGVVSLLGALSVAELGAAYPEAGGQYAYLREAYGPVWGYLYGWAGFAVINSASIAAIAVGFAQYLGFFVPLSPAGVKGVAILSIAALTVINCLGVRLGATVQNVMTILKMGALAALILLAVVLPGGSPAHFAPVWPEGALGPLIAPFGLAMVSALWAYDGWIETTYVGSEVQDPGRNLPISIILSTLIVIALYVLVSAAYIYVVPIGRMAGSTLVASDAAQILMGPVGATFVVLAILVSTLGSNNGIILTAARIPYAMARGGLFFRWGARVHPRFGTPVLALVAESAIGAALTLTGTYVQLTTYVVFASFLFYAMSSGAVIRLRARAPDLPRPYRTWGYPVTPIVFIAFATWLVGNTILEAPRDAGIGAGLILLGLPGYFYWKRRQSSGNVVRHP